MGAKVTAFTDTRLVNAKTLARETNANGLYWPSKNVGDQKPCEGTTAYSVDEPVSRHHVKRVAVA